MISIPFNKKSPEKEGDKMNAYLDNRAYSVRVTPTPSIPEIRVGDKLISFICAVVALLTCSVMVKLEKVAVSAALFFGFFGVVGGIDNGSIGILAGVALCALLILSECLILKSLLVKNKAR